MEEYDKTIFVEEALLRLVELHYYLGLNEEAKNMLKFLDTTITQASGTKQLIEFLIKILNLRKLKNRMIKESFFKKNNRNYKLVPWLKI